MATRIGLDVVTYIAGTIASPVFTNPVGVIKDETVNIEKALADITDRRANGWRLQRGTLKEGTIDLTLNYDPEDADFALFQAAFFNETQMVLFFADGDATQDGTYNGLLAACNVNNFSQPRPLEDAVVVEVSLTLDLEASTDSPPEWHTVVVSS